MILLPDFIEIATMWEKKFWVNFEIEKTFEMKPHCGVCCM
jgi:hypothetical protein